jgi:hypothetical protein
LKLLAKDFCGLFPHINFKSEFSWAETFGSTKDGLPFIGTYKKLPIAYSHSVLEEMELLLEW